jgi:glycosyltransferase involved in cell wall biosynthesis
MRILQIIDSLEAGGAERMAVSYANALANQIDFSGLVATRNEGPLSQELDAKVSYLFLNKKRIVDIPSLLRLRQYVIQKKVNIIHAHGTSFFFAFLLKLTCPTLKLVWHEHYGERANQSKKDNLILCFCSLFFDAVFVVNHQLETWVKKNLFAKKISFLPNFVNVQEKQFETTILKGEPGKRIVFLANLKIPKNHLAIVKVFKALKLEETDWSLHLIGNDYNNDYSDNLRTYIMTNSMENSVFIYGHRNDIPNILSQASIGVLSSTAEGFPVTLLEYGLARLAVLSTNVGYCSLIVKDGYSGLLFDPLNEEQIKGQLKKLIEDKVLRERFALHLQELVLTQYSKGNIIQLILSKYSSIL